MLEQLCRWLCPKCSWHEINKEASVVNILGVGGEPAVELLFRDQLLHSVLDIADKCAIFATPDASI